LQTRNDHLQIVVEYANLYRVYCELQRDQIMKIDVEVKRDAPPQTYALQ
jgi:hypothetical protein